MLRLLPLLLLTACANDPGPQIFLLRTDRGCAREQGRGGLTPEYVKKTFGDKSLALIESIFVADPCSPSGGHYVLGRSNTRQYLLGGVGCETWGDPPATSPYSVAIYTQTASLFKAPAEACVAFPGEKASDFTTDSTLEAVIGFQSEGEAQRFLNEAK